MKCLILVVFLALSSFVSQGQVHKQSDKQSISEKDIKYIPKDLDDCIVQIDNFWHDSIKRKAVAMTEGEFTAQQHFGLGIWMRNNWGLWKGSRLSNYFNKMDIFHPDDMSGIILCSYYRHLKGLDFRLKDQIADYQNYWKVVRVPPKKDYPKMVPDLEFNSGYYYDTKDSGQGYVHVGTSKKTGAIWIYDYYLGWLKVTKYQLQALDSMETRADKLKELYFLKK